MANTDLKTYVIFRSTRFNANWPNKELGIETMEELGKDCAEFLAQKLGSRDRITDVGDVERDDWGWLFSVKVNRENYVLLVKGAMGPQPIYWWSLQVLPVGFVSWLFRRPRRHFTELLETIDEVLSGTDGITDITWATVHESLPDIQTLESRHRPVKKLDRPQK